jgi:hypothetical protein
VTPCFPKKAGFFICFRGLLLDPERGGDTFLLNSGLSPKYTALELRSSYSSVNGSFENVAKFRNLGTVIANHKWINGEINEFI